MTEFKTAVAADFIREIRKLDVRADVLASKRAALVSDLLDLGWDSGKVATQAGPFTVSAVNEYPEAGILANLTPGQATRCMKRVLDRAKVRALYPAVWEAAKVTKGQKVSIG